MWNVLKKIGFSLVVLILTTAIFWLVFLDKQSKHDVLEYSLSLLGDDLMAMVPEAADKKPVQELYDRFLQKTRQGKVEPKQVEYVAANIMNLSNAETEITPEQAEAILQLSLSSPVRIGGIMDDSLESIMEPYFSSEQRKSLGERIKTIYEFNNDMKGYMEDYTANQEKRQGQIKYRIEGDLKIAIDNDLKEEFDRKKFKRMAKELKQLEKERIVEWKENFAEELEQEMENLRLELESLKELTELSQLEALKQLESLESLKSLEMLEFIPVINADSIHAIVEQSLKAAGLDPHKKEWMHHRLDSLKTEIKMDQLEALKELESLKSLESLHESLKSLESLKYMPIIDGDSIRAIVEKSLEQAGIHKRKK